MISCSWPLDLLHMQLEGTLWRNCCLEPPSSTQSPCWLQRYVASSLQLLVCPWNSVSTLLPWLLQLYKVSSLHQQRNVNDCCYNIDQIKILYLCSLQPHSQSGHDSLTSWGFPSCPALEHRHSAACRDNTKVVFDQFATGILIQFFTYTFVMKWLLHVIRLLLQLIIFNVSVLPCIHLLWWEWTLPGSRLLLWQGQKYTQLSQQKWQLKLTLRRATSSLRFCLFSLQITWLLCGMQLLKLYIWKKLFNCVL